MKKFGILFAVCVLLFTANGLAQDKYQPFLLKQSMKNSVAQLKSGVVGSYPRHIDEYNWDTDWVAFQTIDISYNSVGDPVVIEYNQGGTRTKTMYSYNNKHYETEAVTQIMTGGVWVNQSRQVSTYNNLDLPLEMRSEEWISSSWVLQSGTQISYDVDGSRVKVLTAKEWVPESSSWVNSIRETYTYSGSSALYATSVMDMWDNAWVPAIKTEYTWKDNQVSITLMSTYEDSAWLLSGKTIYEWDGEVSSVMTSYTYMGPDEWMPTSRFTYQFDSHGNGTLNQMEMYMGDWTIFSSTKFNLTYSGNNLTQRITQQYSMFPPSTGGASVSVTWKNIKKEVFSNFASLGTDVTGLPDAGLSVFPNPAGKQVFVRIPLLKEGTITLSVVSVTGQKILEKTVTGNGSDYIYQLNLDGVRAGSYFLVTRDKQGNELGKTRLIKEQ